MDPSEFEEWARSVRTVSLKTARAMLALYEVNLSSIKPELRPEVERRLDELRKFIKEEGK